MASHLPANIPQTHPLRLSSSYNQEICSLITLGHRHAGSPNAGGKLRRARGAALPLVPITPRCPTTLTFTATASVPILHAMALGLPVDRRYVCPNTFTAFWDYNFSIFFGLKTIILCGKRKKVMRGNMLFLPLSLHNPLRRHRPFILHTVLPRDDLLIHFGQFYIIQGFAILIPCSKVQAAFLCLHDAVPLSSIFPPRVIYTQGTLRMITWFCLCRSTARIDKTFIGIPNFRILCPLIIFFKISVRGLIHFGPP